MLPVSRILTFLKEHPEGASISEISTALTINRNFAAKYLTTLYMQGQVDLRSYGKVRLYQLCTRVPFHAICLMNDGITLGVDRLGIIREVSGPVETLLNCKEESLRGVQLRDLDHPVFSNPIIQDQVRQLTERKGSKPFHLTRIFGDLILQITLAACIFDDAMTGVGILIRDITSGYRRAEITVCGSNHDLSLIHESTEFIVYMGPDEKILFANPAFATYCGLTVQELIGNQGLPFISLQDMGLIREGYMSTTLERGPGPVCITALFPDGDIRWQQWTAYPSFKNKTLDQIHLHGKDITEQKYQEMEIRELRRGIAHIFDEKISDMREVTLRLSQEIEELKAEGQRLKKQLKRVSSFVSVHPVIILESDSAGKVISATIPDDLSQIISQDQLMGLLLRNILCMDDNASFRYFFEFSVGLLLPFHHISCHIQIETRSFQVTASGIPLKGSDETFDGICIALEFPTGMICMDIH